MPVAVRSVLLFRIAVGAKLTRRPLEFRGPRIPTRSPLQVGLVVAAPRSFVHPFVGVSNKNYDRLSHMLSSRSLPRPDSLPEEERSLAVCSLRLSASQYR